MFIVYLISVYSMEWQFVFLVHLVRGRLVIRHTVSAQVYPLPLMSKGEKCDQLNEILPSMSKGEIVGISFRVVCSGLVDGS